jgi:hypothetical protein
MTQVSHPLTQAEALFCQADQQGYFDHYHP